MEKFERQSSLFQNQQRSLKLKTTEVIINAGDAFELPILVNKPNTILQWIFHSQDYDIDFYITGKENSTDDDSDDDIPDLLEQNRYVATIPHQGQITIPEEGMYYIVWDNSYSWLREKHIVYSVELIFPQPTVEESRSLVLEITDELENKNEELNKFLNEENEYKQSLDQLNIKLQEKQQLLMEIQKEIESTQNSIKTTTEQLSSIQTSSQNITTSINSLYTMSPFLLNGVQMMSYLTGKDILSLASTNKYFNKAMHQDFIWYSIFERESEQTNAILLKNSWITQKWLLLKPDTPIPIFNAELWKEENNKKSPLSVHEIDADNDHVPSTETTSVSNTIQDIHDNIQSISKDIVNIATSIEEEHTKQETAPVEEEKKEEATVVEEKKEEATVAVEEKKEEVTVVKEKKEEAAVVEEKKEEVTVVEEKKEEAAVVEEKKEEIAPVEEKKEEAAVPVEEKKEEAAVPVEEKKEEAAVPVEEEKKEEIAAPVEEEKKEETTTIVEEKKETAAPVEEEKKEETKLSDSLLTGEEKIYSPKTSTLAVTPESVNVETIPVENATINNDNIQLNLDEKEAEAIEDKKQENINYLEHEEVPTVSNLTELKLLHSITKNQGWYINSDDMCYYIYVVNEEQKKFDIWTGPVSLSLLNQLYTKAKHSSVLIACPGTIQGESGFYMDRHRKVTQWTVSPQGWSEIFHN